MKNIAILGSTGKIGTQTLKVIRNFPGEFRVIGLACGHQSDLFNQQIKEFKPKITAISEVDGENKLIKVATHPQVDLVVVAVVGMAGLKPTLAAIKAKKDIALATKEVLVVAGGIVMKEVKKYRINFIPLDSEHSAIWQCLKSGTPNEIRKLIITMGRGVIAQKTKPQLEKVTLKDVFNRPAWSMGAKIAVDSATGMNKAFEIVEAAHLFGVSWQQIEVMVHPEYLCHSLVEFQDGSVIAELGTPDMRRYIQYGLFYPQRRQAKNNARIDLIGKKISFLPPPIEKFPCIQLGFKALKAGGTMSAVMHGADTTAVESFINKKIKFTEIYQLISSVMNKHQIIKHPDLIQVIEAEQWGKQYARQKIGGNI